jgi:hypothetical protein
MTSNIIILTEARCELEPSIDDISEILRDYAGYYNYEAIKVIWPDKFFSVVVRNAKYKELIDGKCIKTKQYEIILNHEFAKWYNQDDELREYIVKSLAKKTIAIKATNSPITRIDVQLPKYVTIAHVEKIVRAECICGQISIEMGQTKSSISSQKKSNNMTNLSKKNNSNKRIVKKVTFAADNIPLVDLDVIYSATMAATIVIIPTLSHTITSSLHKAFNIVPPGNRIEYNRPDDMSDNMMKTHFVERLYDITGQRLHESDLYYEKAMTSSIIDWPNHIKLIEAHFKLLAESSFTNITRATIKSAFIMPGISNGPEDNRYLDMESSDDDDTSPISASWFNKMAINGDYDNDMHTYIGGSDAF